MTEYLLILNHPWFHLISFSLALVLCMGIHFIAYQIIKPKTKEVQHAQMPWGYARLIYPVKRLNQNLFTLFLISFLIFQDFLGFPILNFFPSNTQWNRFFTAFLFLFFYSFFVNRYEINFVRTHHPELKIPYLNILKNSVLVFLFFYSLFKPILILVSSYIYQTPFSENLILMSCCIIFTFTWINGMGLYVMRLLGIAKPSKRLNHLIFKAAEMSHFKVKGVYEIDLLGANAFAYPFLNRISFTTPALKCLSDQEIESIALHEIGHLKEKLSHKILRSIYLPILYVGAVGCFYILSQTNKPEYSLLVLVALALFLIFISRLQYKFILQREKEADHHAASQLKHSVIDYTNALKKLYAFNFFPAVLNKSSKTHPDLYDRIKQAGITPDFEKPLPPNTTTVAFIIFFYVFILGTLISNFYQMGFRL